MKKFFFGCITIFFCMEIYAQKFDPNEHPLNEYRFGGNHIVCTSDNPDMDLNTCNRIGGITVGDDWNVVDKKLGQASKIISQKDGVNAFVYFVTASDGSPAYWVVEKLENKNKVRAIQITGNFAITNASFSSIQLADSEEKVQRILGPRYVVRDVPDIKGIVWDYFPFKFTIEFVGGKVYSIRVANDS